MNHLQSFFRTGTIQEQAVHIYHPLGENRNFLNLDFRNKSHKWRQNAVIQDNIKVTAVVSSEKHRLSFRNIFQSEDIHLCSSSKPYKEKCL